jgi:predicted DNA binding CopG/RHH family protein
MAQLLRRSQQEVQDATLSIRLRREELDTIKKAAKTAGMTLAYYTRHVLLKKAAKKS